MILAVMLRWFAAVALSAVALAQESRPDPFLLSRIRQHMREEIAHVPDYTCLQSAQRYERGSALAALRPLGVIRLEILEAGDQEFLASPGARDFDRDRVSGLAHTGLSGFGIFALFLQDLFVNDDGTFEYRGKESLGGRPAVRYDFRIPLSQSRFEVGVGAVAGLTASRGSFWADPQSFDLLRLEVQADGIPPNLPVASSNMRIDYTRTDIGGRSVLLPQTATADLVERSGAEARNVLSYTHCRAFQTESTLSFAQSTITFDPEPAASAALPAGLSISLTLTALLSGTAPVGSPMEARVAADVVHKGQVLVRAGAPVHGRVRSIVREGKSYRVEIELDEIDNGGAPISFYAQLLKADKPASVRWRARAAVALPGVGTLEIHGPSFTLPRGFRMLWKTIAP